MLQALERLSAPFFLILVLLGPVQFAHAASSDAFRSNPVNAVLLSVQDGVPPGGETLSAGMSLELGEGWKTYWRSPGEVGIPPQIDWSGSENVTDIEMLWPAPERFAAFGIENFGYLGEVVFPLKVALKNPGQATSLQASVNLLVCSDICVPQEFGLVLTLPAGSGVDAAAAEKISEFADRVPVSPDRAGIISGRAHVDGDRQNLTVTLESTAGFEAPDIFAELGQGTALGKPDIRLGRGGKLLWAQVPILRSDESLYHDPVVTVTDGAAPAATLTPALVDTPPPPPFTVAQIVPGIGHVAWIALLAFLGGLILNVMPCVLPVLSFKLSSAIKAKDRSTVATRAGFLFAAGGVMLFMWLLAAALFALKQLGYAVGWGLQFQNPVFLAIMALVLVVFCANLFGLFEFRLPNVVQRRLAVQNPGKTSNHGADFATGFMGAVLATPCSAPFLGTAIAFALTGRGVDILVIFTALGLGLAMPYLLVATFPGFVRVLPRPGRWMIWVKTVLGLLLLGTATWLVWVMTSVAGAEATIAVVVMSLGLVLVLSFPEVGATGQRSAAIAVLIILPVLTAQLFAERTSENVESNIAETIPWVPFDRGEIARRVSRGEVVFLDVTADWCLTCKANKSLVLERDPVLSILQNPDQVVAMQADWTRPDARISQFLEANNRFGIPFNAVFGPSAPDGILLSEVLSPTVLMDAIDAARGSVEVTGSLVLNQ
ncbi:thioredoxin family protein [Seohaeicola saemankumensis]|nr:protein-disulfide reductase DsbD domain-containing protein [Seohaeicola saemankumensis]MCA0871406.1 thioredoxin family protein [Seohaeicola saemankumensis]